VKAAVIVFPGSNCDRDVATALEASMGRKPLMVWHRDTELPDLDLIVVPGGFSYGDYLRCGAMAAHSPIMREVKAKAAAGTRVLGICNGFQILTEAGLLPGVLMRNKGLKYICKPVDIRCETTDTPFSHGLKKGEVLQIPIGHMEGNYFCDDSTLEQLRKQDRIVFRYSTPAGEITEAANPNGAIDNIAGICNEGRNVLGMMPHPERASEQVHGMTDGLRILKSLVTAQVQAAK
jgi:phosphoribosylformylglycinamidine synthase subunit PurQ / glutaminase